MKRIFKEKTITAYHGTTDKGFRTYTYTYYTSDLAYAQEYSDDQGRIRTVEITINNPFIIEGKYMGPGAIIVNNRIIGFYRQLESETVDILIREGYDGIIVNYNGIEAFEIIPFNDSQVVEQD